MPVVVVVVVVCNWIDKYMKKKSAREREMTDFYLISSRMKLDWNGMEWNGMKWSLYLFQLVRLEFIDI